MVLSCMHIPLVKKEFLLASFLRFTQMGFRTVGVNDQPAGWPKGIATCKFLDGWPKDIVGYLISTL